MFVKPQISSFLEGCMVFMYGSGSITQFYILCACFQKLSEAVRFVMTYIICQE